MVKMISTMVALVLLFSCTEDNTNDCTSCELMLAECMKRQTLPVDLPEPEVMVVEDSDYFISIIVTKDNDYLVDGTTYEFAELTQLIEKRIETEGDRNGQIKILGDKKADYEAILMLLSYCKTKDLKPLLTIPD